MPPPAKPKFFIRNTGLEEKLDRLVAERSVIWVCAPVESGKRVSLAAWLTRATRLSRHVYWLQADEGLLPGARIAPAVSDFIRVAAVPVSPAPDDADDGQPIVVLDMGDRQPAAADLIELEATARELPGSFVFILTDGRRSTSHPADAREPDLRASDFQLPEAAVRDAFRLRGADAAFEELTRLHPEVLGLAPVVASYFDQIVNAHRSRPAHALKVAIARHLVTVARRTMPNTGERLMALLSVVPAVPEATARKVVGDPREYAQLRVLATRGLLELRENDDSSRSFAVADELQETLRRLAATSYARNVKAIHEWAGEALAASNDLPGAINEFLQAGREDAAVQVFIDRWDRSLQRRGALRTRMLSMALPPEAVFTSIVATAAVWIVDVVSPGQVPHARHQSDLLAARDVDIAPLSTRDRLTVRAARALIHTRRGAYADADQEVRRAESDAAEVTQREPIRSRGLLYIYRLTRARVALWRGDLTAASKQYDELVEDLDAFTPGIFAFLALKGKVLADALLGEFDAAELTFQRAETLCFDLQLEDSRLGAELLYCAIWLRDNEPGEVGLREVRQAIELGRGTEDIWAHLLSFVDALLLIRKADWEHATQALQSLLRSLPATRQELPLFDSYLENLLGVGLVTLGRPDKALALFDGKADGPSHMPCYSTVRAVALLTKGQPQEALAATENCIQMPDHAAQHIVYTHVTRALASRALGLDEAAEREYVKGLGLVVFRGIRADLRVILSGYLDDLVRRAEEVVPGLVEQARNLLAPGDGADADGTSGTQGADCDISAREWETLRLLATRHSMTEIAASLDLSPSGLKKRTRGLYQKLGASSRQEAVEQAVRRGFIRP